MKAAIHALKYDRLNGAARRLGTLLASAISQLAQMHSEVLVIPVPLHRAKHAQRGFNQARSLAGLTPRQRRQNVRGAFGVSDLSAVEGRHVLLIDDIYTTGATARAASQALIKAGAATVWVATLARARRIYQNRRGSSAMFQDAETKHDLPGSSPAKVSQLASMHSSPNQPSF
jgi:predicted amidophosphoribosyltransferase